MVIAGDEKPRQKDRGQSGEEAVDAEGGRDLIVEREGFDRPVDDHGLLRGERDEDPAPTVEVVPFDDEAGHDDEET